MLDPASAPPHANKLEQRALSSLRRPVWIFDIERQCMVWANPPALRLWDADSLASLLERDFADMSASGRTRLSSILTHLRQGGERREQWTLYPRGKPVTVTSMCSAIELSDKRLGMLVEADVVDEEPLSAVHLRGPEAMRHTSVPNSMFDMTGQLLAQEPTADSTFASLASDSLVTQRRLAEEECRKAGHRFLQLCLQAPMPIYELNLSAECVFVNPAWTALTGLSEAASIGLGWTAALHPDDRDRVLDEWHNVLARSEDYSSNFRCLHANGEQRWLSAKAAPLRDDLGSLTGFLGTLADVTERVQAEQKLRLLFEGSSVAQFVIAASGKVECNESARQLFGISNKGAALAQSIAKLSVAVQSGGTPLTPAALVELVLLRGGCAVEWRYDHPEGRELFLDASLAPTLLRGQQTVFCMLQDITERKQAEMAACAAQEAALEASMLKSQFLANMSHEIRTPMNGVLGMLRLCLATSLSEEQLDYLSLAHRSAENLLEIINDILDLSKIEAGKLDLERVDFQLEDVVKDACDAIKLRAFEKQLELLVEIDTALPQSAVGDPTRLRQVMTNLLGNAVKFTEQGYVKAVLRREVVDGKDMLEVRVTDTGIGIPPERQTAIFQAFSQVDGSTARKYGGTGLGLAISGQLLTMMGGRLDVRSTVGFGSTFSFAIPLIVGSAAESARPRQAERLGKVLIVDDHVEARAVMQRMAQSLGYATLTADGAGSALQLLDELNGEVTAVLIDQRMPCHDGLDFFYMARERGYLRDARCHLLLTGEQLRTAELQSVGFSGSSSKPLLPSDLSRLMLEEAVRSSVIRASQEHGSEPPPPLRVLVAEDHAINAHLVIALLKRQGHRATHVTNGAQALQALAEQRFDVVLMDVQMPVMDGLQAVRLLRRREAAGGPRTTVIALTANAMLGDQEACIQAGMDAYVAKPIDPASLQRALKSVTRASVRPSRETPFSVASVLLKEGSCFARPELLERVCGDMSFYAEMIKMFLASLDVMVVELETSIRSSVDEDVNAAAHRLKGALRLIAASHAARTAQALEFAAKEGWRDNYELCMARLRPELDELTRVLHAELEQL